MEICNPNAAAVRKLEVLHGSVGGTHLRVTGYPPGADWPGGAACLGQVHARTGLRGQYFPLQCLRDSHFQVPQMWGLSGELEMYNWIFKSQ